MSEPEFTVFVVDDDPAVCRGLSRLLGAAAYRARTFASPRDFLAQHDPSIPGCAVIDLVMPDGGKGDIPTSVCAMRAGAVDFLTKPVGGDALLAAVRRAQEADARARESRGAVAAVAANLAKLTPREREVLNHVVAGRLNKQIAGDLGTVEKTIKVHRGRMMRKLGMRTVQDLVRLAERAGIRP
jgi:FixJ family two-component response regulator